MTILIFAAHPDDEVLGVGGTILKFKNNGEKVISIITSYGEFSHPWMKEKYTKDLRRKECLNVKKFLGVDETIFLGILEGKFNSELKKKEQKLLNIIKKEKIKKIFSNSPSDPHPDHNACYNFIHNVIKKNDLDVEFLCFDIWNPLIIKKRHMPKVYYDISKYMHKKNEAVNMYESQKHAMILMGLKPLMWIKAFLNGLKINKRFAEGFLKIK